MSNTPSASVPAGWYPDPAGSFQQRWWNGTGWTNDFAQYRPSLVHAPAATAGHGAEAVNEALVAQQQAAQRAADQVAAAMRLQRENSAATAFAAERARTQTLTRNEPPAARPDPLPTFTLPSADQAPQTTVAQPNAASATLIPVRGPSTQTSYNGFGDNTNGGSSYQPFHRTPEVRTGVRQRAERAHTVSAWLMPFTPLPFVAAAIALASLQPEFYTLIAIAVLLVLFLATNVGLAARDARSLSLDGHFETASPTWVLLTPIAYLILRTAAVSRETRRVVPWMLLAALLVVAGIVAAAYLVPGLASLLTGVSAL